MKYKIFKQQREKKEHFRDRKEQKKTAYKSSKKFIFLIAASRCRRGEEVLDD